MKTQDTKTFAFQLAAKKNSTTDNNKKWQVRDGVAVAGCTGFSSRYDEYESSTINRRDRGAFC